MVKQISANLFTIEPGDATHYEFTIVRNGDFVIGHGRPNFMEYRYESSEIEQFFVRHPEIKNASYENYQTLAIQGKLFDDQFASYIIEKSGCNPWTAFAFLRCAAFYLEKLQTGGLQVV
jgi:hypothetical protein